MTPTIEEVKRVAIERGISAEVRYEQIEELQAFAQHWIEVGRKEQRESDEEACENIGDEYTAREGKRLPELRSDAATGAYHCMSAIRNNTGRIEHEQ